MAFPEEDPSTFHFLVAWVYENLYQPIKPVATMLGKSVPFPPHNPHMLTLLPSVPDDKGNYPADLDAGVESDSSISSSR